MKKRVRCDLSGNQSQRCASFFSTASTKLAFRTHLSVIFLCFLFLLLLPRLNFQVHTSEKKKHKQLFRVPRHSPDVPSAPSSHAPVARTMLEQLNRVNYETAPNDSVPRNWFRVCKKRMCAATPSSRLGI